MTHGRRDTHAQARRKIEIEKEKKIDRQTDRDREHESDVVNDLFAFYFRLQSIN